MTEELLKFVPVVVVAVGGWCIAFAFIFLYHFSKAPHLIFNEQEAKIKELEQEIIRLNQKLTTGSNDAR